MDEIQVVQDSGRLTLYAARVNALRLHMWVTGGNGTECQFPLTRDDLMMLQQLLSDVMVGRCAAEGLAYRASEAGRLKVDGKVVWVCPTCWTPLEFPSDDFPF